MPLAGEPHGREGSRWHGLRHHQLNDCRCRPPTLPIVALQLRRPPDHAAEAGDETRFLDGQPPRQGARLVQLRLFRFAARKVARNQYPGL